MKLSAHEAFFLLKNSFAIPKLQFLLRTSPCLSQETLSFDETVKNLLSEIINVRLDETAWTQASLPVRWGGIGIRKAELLAPAAFLASSYASSRLVSCLLPGLDPTRTDDTLEDVLASWMAIAGCAPPSGPDACSQRAWDDGISSASYSNLLLQAGAVDQARLRASAAPESGAWIQALPCANLGLPLKNDELRIAVGLHLGTPLTRAHRCRCGV